MSRSTLSTSVRETTAPQWGRSASGRSAPFPQSIAYMWRSAGLVLPAADAATVRRRVERPDPGSPATMRWLPELEVEDREAAGLFGRKVFESEGDPS